MIVLIALIAGFTLGWVRATRRGGTRADKWQYALAHAIPFALGGLALSILGLRLGWGV